MEHSGNPREESYRHGNYSLSGTRQTGGGILGPNVPAAKATKYGNTCFLEKQPLNYWKAYACSKLVILQLSFLYTTNMTILIIPDNDTFMTVLTLPEYYNCPYNSDYSVSYGYLTSAQMSNYYNVINQVISYWPNYGSEVCCIGPRPKAMGQYSKSRTRNWANAKLLD